MKVQLSLLFISTLVLGACAPETEPAPAAQPAAERSADETALDEVRADYVGLYNAGDAAGVANLYVDSAIALWADGVISMGKPAILENIQGDLAGSPTLELATDGTMFFGDNAVGHGRYTVSMTVGEAPVSLAGHYLTHFERRGGEWRIGGVITNFEAPPPEGMLEEPPEMEAPPDEGTLQAFTAAYAQAVQARDWDAIAAMYTDDAVVAFSNLAPVRGPAGVRALYAERFGDVAPTMEIHDVGTLDLGDGHALDGGWYRWTAALPEGAVEQGGTYMSLVQQQADGSWKIRWQVTNGQPGPAS